VQSVLDVGYDEALEMLEAIQSVLSVYSQIRDLRIALKPANDIMKADSPNNAINTTLATAILQQRQVTIVKEKLDSSKSPFRGN